MTIVEFLRARLDEDEAAARACGEVFPSPWDVTDRGHSATVRADEPHFPIVTALEQSDAIDGWLGDRLTHFVRRDPARVLAEVEAKRRIVELHEMIPETMYRTPWIPEDPGSYDVMVCAICGIDDDRPVLAGPCATLRLLALPYAGHPGYDEEWHI